MKKINFLAQKTNFYIVICFKSFKPTGYYLLNCVKSKLNEPKNQKKLN